MQMVEVAVVAVVVVVVVVRAGWFGGAGEDLSAPG